MFMMSSSNGCAHLALRCSGSLPEMPNTSSCDGGLGVGTCGHLLAVNLVGNKFSGHLPLFLARSLMVVELVVSNNAFSGSISSQLACSLKNLRLDNNRFSGSLPWGNRSVLKVPLTLLGISVGSFQTCPLFGPTMAYLSALSVSFNRLSGTVPINNCDLGIMNLSFDRNILELQRYNGTLPICSNVRRWLKQLLLDDNRISGTLNFNRTAFDPSWIPNNTVVPTGFFDLLNPNASVRTEWGWLLSPNVTEFPHLTLINYGHNHFSGTISALPDSMQVHLACPCSVMLISCS